MSSSPEASTSSPGLTDILDVPDDPTVRARLREGARRGAAGLDPARPPTRDDLQAAGEQLLGELKLPRTYLGYIMVQLDNAFWEADYQAVPPARRLLLLPRCLSHASKCQARLDGAGLHCVACGACVLAGLIREAQALGTRVIVAEGTSAATDLVLEGEADALLGVACLESLERSFQRIADLGIPHQALPLLTSGCRDTTADVAEIRAVLGARGAVGRRQTRTYLPLLREARQLFEPAVLVENLPSGGGSLPPGGDETSLPPLAATEAIAFNWLGQGGKRLRPFITLAAYAVGRHGVAALAPAAPLGEMLPVAVRRLAVAIEALHKASLIHDDIEDHDSYRYDQPTVHRVHGLEVGINTGDYLVGLGYRLIAQQSEALGSECIAAVLQHLGGAHLRLCEGQGAELLWQRQPGPHQLTAMQALQIGALKTAPAFEAALYTGLRAAGVVLPEATLRQFAVYTGEAYQIQNDLADWDDEAASKGARGLDALSQRPTILRALACEAGGGNELDSLLNDAGLKLNTAIRSNNQMVSGATGPGTLQTDGVPELSNLPAATGEGAAAAVTARVALLYERLGVFEQARALQSALRQRALNLAASLSEASLAELFAFLVRNLLRP